jgi:hypothetical protein
VTFLVKARQRRKYGLVIRSTISSITAILRVNHGKLSRKPLGKSAITPQLSVI